MTSKIIFTGDQVTGFGTVTLGALIAALEPLRQAERYSADDAPSDRVVYFDFGGTCPDYMDSYRGYYDHLAMTFENQKPAPPVGGVIAMLAACDGHVFTGYKGGEYRMNLNTPVWVANHGTCDSTAIVGVLIQGYRATILTEYLP